MALKNDPLIEPLMKIDLRRNRISYKEPFVPYSAIEWESFFINLLKQYRLSYKLFDEFKKEIVGAAFGGPPDILHYYKDCQRQPLQNNIYNQKN